MFELGGKTDQVLVSVGRESPAPLKVVRAEMAVVIVQPAKSSSGVDDGMCEFDRSFALLRADAGSVHAWVHVEEDSDRPIPLRNLVGMIYPHRTVYVGITRPQFLNALRVPAHHWVCDQHVTHIRRT